MFFSIHIGKTLRLQLLSCLTAAFSVVGIAHAQQTTETESNSESFIARHKLKLSGSLMLDLANVGGIYTDGDRSDEADVRRARIGLSGDISKRLDAEITLDLDGDDSTVELHDAALRYSHAKNNSLKIGLIKQPFGLENSTSSRKLATMERSMAGGGFAPDRGYGISLSTSPGNHFLAIGAFADPDLDDVYDITGRATYAPVKNKQSVLHFGVNAAYRENKLNRYRIRDSGIVQDGENFFRSGNYNPEQINTLGLEAAWGVNSFSVQTEWFKQTLLLDDTESSNPDFTGGYITFSLVLNQGRRKYKNGEFNKVSSGKKGPAVELVASIGELDTTFGDRGDQAKEFVIGANYRINDNIRFAGQLQHLATVEAEGEKDSGNSLLIRIQIDFEAKANKKK